MMESLCEERGEQYVLFCCQLRVWNIKEKSVKREKGREEEVRRRKRKRERQRKGEGISNLNASSFFFFWPSGTESISPSQRRGKRTTETGWQLHPVPSYRKCQVCCSRSGLPALSFHPKPLLREVFLLNPRLCFQLCSLFPAAWQAPPATRGMNSTVAPIAPHQCHPGHNRRLMPSPHPALICRTRVGAGHGNSPGGLSQARDRAARRSHASLCPSANPAAPPVTPCTRACQVTSVVSDCLQPYGL